MNKKNQIIIVIIFVISGLFGFLTSLYMHQSPVELPSEPQVRETYHYPATFVKQLVGDPQAGGKIFKEFCSVCHDKAPKIDVRAPRLGDVAIWKAKKALGMPVLLKLTIQGVGAMPARGGCFECSDKQLSEAIQYMLDHSHD